VSNADRQFRRAGLRALQRRGTSCWWLRPREERAAAWRAWQKKYPGRERRHLFRAFMDDRRRRIRRAEGKKT